jgi:hypothetical protein
MLLAGGVLNGCKPEMAGLQDQVGFIQELEDGKQVKVFLDPVIQHEHRVFATLEERWQAELSQAATGSVTINKGLYERLGHYFDALQIWSMDMDGCVTVADTVYKASETQLIRWPKQNPSEVALDIWYDKDGQGFIREYLKAKQGDIGANFKNRHLLSKVDLKASKGGGSEVKYLATYSNHFTEDTKYLVLTETQNRPIDEGDSTRFLSKNDSTYWLAKGAYPFRYRDTPNGVTKVAFICIELWNYSYQSGGDYRGSGGLGTRVLRPSNGSGWAPFYSLPSDADSQVPIGNYHQSGLPDNVPPYSWVKIKTSRDEKQKGHNSWKVHVSAVNRTSGRSTWGWYSFWLRKNNTNQQFKFLEGYDLQ